MRSTAIRLPLACSLVAVLAALSAPAGASAASGPPHVYPSAADIPPAPPRLGPAPDLEPVPGQDPTPPVLRNCVPTGVPQGLPGVDPRAARPRSPNPLRGLRWFVDPREWAFRSYRSYMSRGQRSKARLMWQLARQPKFRWFGRFTRPRMVHKVREYLNCVAAIQPGAVPLMAVLRHEGKRCDPRYVAGGRAEDRRTRRWYDQFAKAVGDARVILAFEPDSLGTVDCLARHRRRSRLDNMRYGIDVLSKLPNVTIYIEAGASDWEPARRTAKQLRYVGIRKVRGFMLNVTHDDWTAANIEHGLEISRRTGGKPFIVSTHSNGRGPVHYRRWIDRSRGMWRRVTVWCNPLKRGSGPAPTTRTVHRKVDAYMWIGRPGYSGGSCNGGPIGVGKWWPEYALMLARYSTSWLRAPRGTRHGHRRRYSLKQLGA